MKRQKLLKKRFLALALSAAMIFAQADTYTVLAAAPDSGISDLDTTNSGTLDSSTTNSNTTDSTATGDSGSKNGSIQSSNDAYGAVDTDQTEAADETQNTEGKEETENTENTNGTELPEEPSTDGSSTAKPSTDASSSEEPSTDETSSDQQENNKDTGNVDTANEDAAEESETGTGSGSDNGDGTGSGTGTDEGDGTGSDDGNGSETGSGETAEIVESGTAGALSWSIDADGLLTISGTGDYMTAADLDDEYYLPSWSGKTNIKSAKVAVSGITYTKNMFKNCGTLTSVDLSELDTSNVTNMAEMFSGCSSLQSLNLNNLNTGNVTDMSYMFNGCRNLSSLELGGLDTGKVTNMRYMFFGCSGLQSLDLRNFNTSNVTDMGSMFSGCSGLQSLDVSSFDTANVTDMNSMFNCCSRLRSLDVSNFDTGNVKNMRSMFTSVCEYITSLDLSNFDTGNVTNMGGMFSSNPYLQNLDISSFDTRNVTDMSSMFSGCEMLSNVDLSGFVTDKVKNMSRMFHGCANPSYAGVLTVLDLSSFDMVSITSNYLTDGVEDMLGDANSLTCICTPRNCSKNVALPTGTWYDESGSGYTYLPKNLDHSIALYKGGYPSDGTSTMKKVAFLSGISIEDKVYNKTPIAYTGTAVAKDFAGETITDVTISAYYTGILADGSKYVKTEQAPSQAGNYKLSLEVSGSDSYIFSQTSYPFSIKPVVLTITAPSVEIDTGETIPELSLQTAAIEGLLEGENLTTPPQLKYGEADIPNNVAGVYDIIAYGADAGSNYSINYVKGTLTVTEAGVVENPNAQIIYSGTSGALTWTIDTTGLLVVNGSGDYQMIDEITFFGEKAPEWCSAGRASLIYYAKINVSGITTMENMFYDCYNLKRIDFTDSDTSNVKSMKNMFHSCEKLERLDLSGLNTGNVTDMRSMFNNCPKMSKVDLSGFDTSKVTNMNRMFYGCEALTSLDLSSFNTSKVTNMVSIFENCYALKSVDVSSFNTSNLTRMDYMFGGCALTSVDVSGFNTSKVTNMDGMFYGCQFTDLNVSGFDTSKVTNMSAMFAGCSKLTSLDLSTFNTAKVTSMEDMFEGCSSLVNLDISSFNTSNVKSMFGMFEGCSSLASLDLSSFNTAKVTDMPYMFKNCSSLVSLNLSSFNTSKVTDMLDMFVGCSSLTELDLSSFNTKKTWWMDGMFAGCSSLTSLDLGGFDMSSVVVNDEESYAHGYGDAVFKGCDSLFYIRAPKNCPVDITLPTGANGTDIWYQELNTPCTALPKAKSASVDLYRNGYPGDGTTKKIAFISGISISSMVYSGKEAKYFGTAAVVDSDKKEITGAIPIYSYTGTLADGSPYAGQEQAPSQAGSYKLVIRAEGSDYSGQASYSFRIDPKAVVVSAPSRSIAVNAELPVLTELSCTVTGLLSDDKLTVEPALKYSDSNISTASPGRYGIIPFGADAGYNYRIAYKEGTLTVGDPDDDTSFTEEERTSLNSGESSLSCTIAPIKAKTYTGVAIEPVLKVTVTENGKKKKLVEGIDYRVVFENNVDAGTATAIVRGSGIYKGSASADFTINRKPVKKLKVVTGGFFGTLSKADVENENLSLPVYVYDSGKLLERGTDYTLEYDSEKKGNVTVKVKGMDTGNYTGETKAKIPIYTGTDEDADHKITPEIVNLSSYTVKYTGKALKPAVEVRIKGELLPSKNYKVKYQNNKNAGTAYVIVTGKGAYKGKAVVAFEITSNSQSLSISNIKTQTYKGKYIKPSVTVKAGSKKLRKNKDYILTYKNNFHAGEAAVTITGIGNYTGTATQTFTINPANAAKITVKGVWKDNNGDGIKDSGALLVYYGKRQLKEGVDFTLETDGTITKNKVKVTIKGVEGRDFTGSVSRKVKAE